MGSVPGVRLATRPPAFTVRTILMTSLDSSVGIVVSSTKDPPKFLIETRGFRKGSLVVLVSLGARRALFGRGEQPALPAVPVPLGH
jgi:hypothetical protein